MGGEWKEGGREWEGNGREWEGNGRERREMEVRGGERKGNCICCSVVLHLNPVIYHCCVNNGTIYVKSRRTLKYSVINNGGTVATVHQTQY